MDIAKYIDHTILKPEATVEDVKKLCKEAKEYNFASVCVNGCYAKLVSTELMGTDVKTCVVVGFPLGAMTKESKAFETNQAIENGATEIDMVINVGALKDKNYSLLKEDIEAVVNAAKGKALVKVIIETCLLSDEEKVKACEIAKEAKADFVKTSTGFSSGGATKEDIALMRKTVGSDLGVKASGGVRDFKTAMDMINAGASRIGASASISIVSESK
ncbi:deoxyribose-phosphate aldolase [Clostridium beijerinckii]|jgi:deoxyribose-phosphate aldolase|uniref:Deoxyribose-phosphate aldolase n=3 Tax=Clostridium beijerinckii TaxID=1520 RepID=A0A1S8R236_CLOBE|nr:deoxyribose-phosphate aldolase [Clostridium beijerinckii]ABR36253.1 deoxyribose-phosphate aldolase [Clostridium beijerinckii NCIMB 8052]AIU00542.1 deoxyribose-phosphate aldolase [Clostridium beijerinckii ATCC 35702]MBF7809100.1 deoxyribose-phosphate aldolase [Clostridium beijerinckii]MDG5856986.1 deoxyribose-phosphate aldolase [Clostridium beijerinckii]NOW89596.1 deoxyribose-phosphate aldolase [Clostridium beijerinckii]